MADETRLDTAPSRGGWSAKPQSPGAIDAQSNGVGATPVPDCWASKQPQSPGAADNPSHHAERFANFGAMLSAFIASSWCWLPPLLILGGISGVGMTTFISEYRAIFLVANFGLLGLAFYFTYRPGRQAIGRTSKMVAINKIMLWVVLAFSLVLLFSPQTITGFFEPETRSEITADMQKTVIRIEGMTWHTWAPKAAAALKTAPGVLAVDVDYESKSATIGTDQGKPAPRAAILEALRSIGYRGEIVENAPTK